MKAAAILVLLSLPAPVLAQQSVPPGGHDCETPPACALGTLWNPGTKACEPVSS